MADWRGGACRCGAAAVGAFGPHGPELLQLKRNMWGAEAAGEHCITAFKLSGDVNVPSGMASFRAKVGREHRIDHHGCVQPPPANSPSLPGRDLRRRVSPSDDGLLHLPSTPPLRRNPPLAHALTPPRPCLAPPAGCTQRSWA